MNNTMRIIVLVLFMAAISIPVWLWMRAPLQREHVPALSTTNTPTQGRLRVAVDRSLAEAVRNQPATFSSYYSGAVVELLAEDSSHPLLYLLKRNVSAALLNGQTSKAEDSVMTTAGRVFRREPVARNAIVCLVNRRNPSPSISLDQLTGIVSGKITSWKSIGGWNAPLMACIDGGDFRFGLQLSDRLFKRAERLSAVSLESQAAVLSRVAVDEGAIGFTMLPAAAAFLRSEEGRRMVRILPVSVAGKGTPVEPSQDAVYSGAYPLGTIVYYIYDAYDPLAAGFGAWLAREGQKTFESGDLAPFRQHERTIILKQP